LRANGGFLFVGKHCFCTEGEGEAPKSRAAEQKRGVGVEHPPIFAPPRRKTKSVSVKVKNLSELIISSPFMKEVVGLKSGFARNVVPVVKGYYTLVTKVPSL